MFMNSLIQAYKNTFKVVDSGNDTNRKIEDLKVRRDLDLVLKLKQQNHPIEN